ncbi:MAG TPA: hypothetical protein PKX48_13550 [Planctomycetota bacterium]|jgi:photosystem II stability/assembly factor-like uncharacterized protein|nr:hypothetical protein [Planctomycetota bacterium]OQC21901.1 MAG: Xyloglucanase precursor [Planctomycetes bacterium ADurb.Bin069]HNU27391.1 hypothetical protein [Planctomycetota bacterium]HOE29586.1 hypothetical protein [Planctomycetota bacterium]HOE86231.1 hypothetical protein [Planctomycetota bacterium]
MRRTSSVIAVLALAAAIRGAEAWRPASWGGGDIFLSIASHPGDDRVLWAIAWLGGVLTSDDQGETWRWANGDLATLEAAAIVPDPADVKGAYLAGPSGLWHTADRGAHWTPVPGTEKFAFARVPGSRPLLICEDGRCVAGTATGELFTRAGGGGAWQPVPWPNSRAVYMLREVPARGAVLIALADAAGLFVFKPNLRQAPSLARGAPPFPIKDMIADESPPYRLFAVCGPHGLWAGEATGDDWQRLELEGVEPDEELLCLARTGRGRERLLFACGIGLLLRSENGTHWKRLKDNRHFDERANPTRRWSVKPSVPAALSGGLSPDNLFLADYWSLHRCLNSTGDAQFVEAVRGAGSQAINDLALDGSGALLVAGGASGLLITADGGRSFAALWPARYGPDVGQYAAVAVGPGDALIAAAVDRWKGEVCLYHGSARERRIDGRGRGVNFAPVIMGDGAAAAGPWRVVFAPADTGRAYALVAGADPALLMTADGGGTWKTRRLPAGANPWRALAADPERSDCLYVGGRAPAGGVWKSSDAGARWEQILALNESVAALAALPGGVVCALTESGIFHRSATRGAIWDAPAATGLAQASALCAGRSELFAGGGNAVRLSGDGGASWSALPGPPMHLPEITALCADPRLRTLFVGTRGAGLWKIAIGPPAE